MELTSPNVENLFLDCLFKEGEDTTNAVLAEGVMLKVGFNPERLAKNREEIISLLSQCDEKFMAEGSAKGYSFLGFCEDKNGNLWTGVHAVCDNLICMGLAIDKVVFLLPREVWAVLPGGMPYLAIKNLS